MILGKIHSFWIGTTVKLRSDNNSSRNTYGKFYVDVVKCYTVSTLSILFALQVIKLHFKDDGLKSLCAY